jgi:hypothetical protein
LSWHVFSDTDPQADFSGFSVAFLCALYYNLRFFAWREEIAVASVSGWFRSKSRRDVTT